MKNAFIRTARLSIKNLLVHKMRAYLFKSILYFLKPREGGIMLIPNKSHQNYASDPIKNTHPNSKIRLVEPESVVNPTQMDACQGEDRFLDYDQENGFFKGLLFTLPCSILVWVIVIWGIRSLVY